LVNLSNTAPFHAAQDGTVVQFRLTDTNRLKINNLTFVFPFLWLGTAQERIDTAGLGPDVGDSSKSRGE
jgi:hypothetical protein